MSEYIDAMKNGNAGATPFLSVSAGPHLRDRESVPRMMLFTIAALVPAAALAIVLYKGHAALLIVSGVAAAAAAEWAFLSVGKKRLVMIDGSAALTGLLLALSLPPDAPLWMAPAGAVFAIAIVKMAFGGLGCNFLNPAVAGRAFLTIAFPAALGALSTPVFPEAGGKGLINVLIGQTSGWMGGGSAGALLAGSIALLCLRLIDFSAPLAFIGSVFALFLFTDSMNTPPEAALISTLYQLCSGGVLLGAFFMATDPVTSPTTRTARLLFGAGCGVVTFCFMKFGNANDSVMWALLLMNLSVPYLNRYCRRKPFGARMKKNKQTIAVTDREGGQ